MQTAIAPLWRRRRLVTGDIGVTRIVVAVRAFDIDAPDHQATPEWRAWLRSSIDKLLSAHPGGFYYETRNGSRLVYRTEEREISTREDARDAARCYLVELAHLARCFGIVADPACADVFRLSRLACVARTPGAPAERLPTIGDPHAISVLRLETSEGDRARARELAPRAFDSASHPTRPEGPATPSRSVRGPLYAALASAGLIVRPGPLPASFVIVCPRQHTHSVGAAGDGSTLLHLPTWFAAPGFIDCKHASCAHMRTARQWRRALGDGVSRPSGAECGGVQA
jgi:hypothetical protein